MPPSAGAAPPSAALLASFGAAAHIMQAESGSAVAVGATSLLTCAHCVSAASDPDVELASDSSSDDGSPAATSAVQRVGRFKLLLMADGAVVVARCVAADDALDLALLSVEASSPAGAALYALPVAAAADAAGRRRVICVGNPHDFDGDGKRSKFDPPVYFTSAGAVVGRTDADRLRMGLGGLRHTCWTHWGHSGAPLISTAGEIAALHNSWDGGNGGTRHAVGCDDIARFLAAHGFCG